MAEKKAEFSQPPMAYGHETPMAVKQSGYARDTLCPAKRSFGNGDFAISEVEPTSLNVVFVSLAQ